MKPRPVVFIHGMYMTPLCWQGWIAHFQARGFDGLAPAWPGRDRTVAELRARHPDPELGALTLSAVIEHLAGVVQGLGVRPVLVGHSMGGLIVQLLLQRGVAAAGVAIDSAPPQGVFTARWSFVRSNWGHVNPLIPRSRPVAMTFERFRYAFVNGLPENVQRVAFDTQVVPESRRIPAESLTRTARVDFRRPGAPLLLIAGSQDNLIPASLNRRNHARYRRPASVTDFREFAGRTHFIIGQDGWQEVADYVATWIGEKVG
jgi:pimeloyl-ACP methyl ester carboxylesterase